MNALRLKNRLQPLQTKAMVSYQDALERMLKVVQPLASERLPLTAAYGRIVATPLVASHPMPPFDQSLVDGYALRSSDTRTATPAQPVRLMLGQTLTAGEHLEQPLGPRQAIRIMTGAPVPPGQTPWSRWKRAR
jgi:molybdopterin molybdotransferase